MTALAELREGSIGESFFALTVRTALAVGAARNFPPPEGGEWTEEAAIEVATMFFADDQTPRRLDWLLLRSGTDRELARSLQGVMRNFLRDLGRSTVMGRLVVRVRRALRESDSFVASGDRWHLTTGPAYPSGAGPDQLSAAAATVKVTFQQWSSTSLRNEPFADKESVERLIHEVLLAADGSLRPADIAIAVAPSLHVPTGNPLVELDRGDGVHEIASPSDPGTCGHDIVLLSRALEVLELLTDRQRLALAHPELSKRELGPVLGVGHSQAAIILSGAVELLRSELAGEDEGQEIAMLVVELSKSWMQRETTSGDQAPQSS